jgi:hypothetical protein
MAAELVDRLAILVVVRRFPGMGVPGSRSLPFDSSVRMHHFVRRNTYVPFRRFLGDVRREFMQRLYASLIGTMGSYLRDGFPEGSAIAVACILVPRAWVFSLFSSFCLVASTTFSCNFFDSLV